MQLFIYYDVIAKLKCNSNCKQAKKREREKEEDVLIDRVASIVGVCNVRIPLIKSFKNLKQCSQFVQLLSSSIDSFNVHFFICSLNFVEDF